MRAGEHARMHDYVEVATQAQLDKAVKNGDIPVCRKGFFSAYDSATVDATPYVAIHKFGTGPKVKGGVVIDVPTTFESVAQWCDYYGVKQSRGRLTVFKGVDANLVSSHGMQYEPGSTVTAPDWDAGEWCGNGLHFSPRAFLTHRYTEAVRYLACTVKASDVTLLGDKIKAPSCKVLHEVDIDGERVPANV